MPNRFVISGLLFVALTDPVPAADWPWWRGPTHDGISSEVSGYPGHWPPRRLWRAEVGFGCTSPIVVSGRVYVMGWSDASGKRPRSGDNPEGTDTLFCFDAGTGKERWRQSSPGRYQGLLRTGDTAAYGGPSATPALDPERGWIFTLSVDGDLRCRDVRKQGALIWSRQLHDQYTIVQRPNVGGGRRDYGFATSPLIQGDLLLVQIGAREGMVAAFDVETGAQRWLSEYREPAGHAGGMTPFLAAGKACLAVMGLSELVVISADPRNGGKTIARYPWTTDFACNIPTPAVAGNRILVTSAYNRKQSVLLELSPQGLRPLRTARQHALVSTPVLHKGSVYTIAGPVRRSNLSDGKKRWSGSNFGHGSCVATADDKLIVFGRGRLALIDARPEQGSYRELGSIEKVVSGTCYPHIALSNGFIVCKDRDGHLVVYSVGASFSGPAGRGRQ